MRRFPQLSMIAFILLLCASPLWANYSPFPVRGSLSQLPSNTLLDLASDSFFVLITLVLLRQRGNIALGMIVRVCLFAMAAGYAADGIGLGIIAWLNDNPYAPLPIIQAFPICALLIAVANYSFGRYYFKLNESESMIMGVVLGVCTMPVAVLLAGHSNSYGATQGRYGYEVDNALTSIIFGAVFAVADAILLHIIRPITPVKSWKIAMAVIVAAGLASSYCLYPILELRKEERVILACSREMKDVACLIEQYRDQHDHYPPDIAAIPKEFHLKSLKMHCPLYENGTASTSYEYRKPVRGIKELDSYWMLKCTHHPKYDLYVSAIGMSMKALPKDESYE